MFFDLSKAFDKVSHPLLLRCLSDTFGLPDYLCALIQNYLSGRSQVVRVCDCLSNSAFVASGVPQGSIVGPLLFIAFANSVTSVQLSGDAQLVMYADDLALIEPVIGTAGTTALQSDIDLIAQHFTNTLSLPINTTKTKSQVFARSEAGVTQRALQLSDSPIDSVCTQRYLGAILNNTLSYTQHSNAAVAKVKRGVSFVCRTFRKAVPLSTLCLLYNALFMPTLLYAVAAVYPTCKKDRTALERAHKFAARSFLRCFDRDVSYEALLQRVRWLPLYRLAAVSRLVTCHKYVSAIRHMPPGCVVSKASAGVRVSPRVDHCRSLCVPRAKYSSCVSALSSMCSVYNLLPNSCASLPVKQFKRFVSDPAFLVPFLSKCPKSFVEQLFI